MTRLTRWLPPAMSAGALLSFLAPALDVPRLAAPFGGRELQVGVGVCLVLSAIALELWIRRVRPFAARMIGLVLALLGAMGLAKHLMLSHTLSADATTSICFGAVGVGFMFFDTQVKKIGARVAEIASLVAWAAVLTTGFDWAAGFFLPSVDDISVAAAADAVMPAPQHALAAVERVSPYTLFFMTMAASSLLTARPRDGWMAVLAARTPAARDAALLLRALPIIVVVISLLRFLGEARGYFDSRYGVSLMVGSMSFVLIIASWRTLYAQFRSEGEVLHSRAVLDAIVENIPHMIFVKDGRELRFVRFNAAGERLLGMKRDELIGKNDFDFFPKEQAEHFQAKDRATLTSTQPVDILEEEIDTKGGKRWLHTVKVPVHVTPGDAPLLLGISEDITQRKAAQDELRRAKESAEATSRELEAFSYSVSHDLRAPLRSIDGFSQAVLEDAGDKLDPEARGHLDRVRAAAQRMASLIDDLLNLSRVSRQELKRDPVDVSALAHGVVDELRRAAPDRAVDVVIAADLRAVGDARLIEVLLENLIGNAWKFTSKNPPERAPRIEVGVRSDGAVAAFFVKDNGAGFDMAYANKLFGAFQRLHSATEFDGTGIGLATVQRIAHRHGGRVWAEAEVGRGATFSFTLAAPSSS